MAYVVFTEFHQNGTTERWYYGTYESEARANEVAYQLGHCPEEGYWRCVCALDEAESWGILNMPV